MNVVGVDIVVGTEASVWGLEVILGQGWIGGCWRGEFEGKGHCYTPKQRLYFVHSKDQMEICLLRLTHHCVCVFTVHTVRTKKLNLHSYKIAEQINVITLTLLAFWCKHERFKYNNSCMMKYWPYTEDATLDQLPLMHHFFLYCCENCLYNRSNSPH